MGAAVEDVHHRDGKLGSVDAAEEAVKRDIERGRDRFSGGEGDGENRVRAEVRLVFRAVELDHRLVDRVRVGGVHPFKGGGDLLVDVGDRLGDALAAELALVAVAEFKSFEFAGGSAGGGRRAAYRAVGKRDFGFDRGVAAGVDDFATVDLFNLKIIVHYGFSLIESYKRIDPRPRFQTPSVSRQMFLEYKVMNQTKRVERRVRTTAETRRLRSV